MSERRKVPVAYVTKWATTRGILVVKGGEETEGGHFNNGTWLWVAPNHWTEDKDVAEKRWYAAVKKARDAAKQKAKALDAKLAKPAPYTEES